MRIFGNGYVIEGLLVPSRLNEVVDLDDVDILNRIRGYNLNIVNGKIVAARINVRILCIRPFNGKLAILLKGIFVQFPFTVLICAPFLFCFAIDFELALIPEGRISLAPCLEVECKSITCICLNSSSEDGRRAALSLVA